MGRVLSVKPGNLWSAAIFMSMKTGSACKGGNAAAPMMKQPTMSLEGTEGTWEEDAFDAFPTTWQLLMESSSFNVMELLTTFRP